MFNPLLRRHAMLAGGLIFAAAVLNYTVTAAAAMREATVAISGFAFVPAQLIVPAGTRIIWTNRDDIPHTVTHAATPRLFGSPALDTGERYARVFDKPGTYRYFCAIHPHMQGVVVVQ